MGIKVYNTLSRSKEDFIPREPGKVSIYVCGVTPYDYAHIGNARPPVFWDTVRRFLKYRGYQVTYIQNFTDIDDKIINRARQLGREPLDLAAEYTRIYLEDLAALDVLPADRFPKVSEHIPEIIGMIKTLVEKGYAYELKGDVYYAVDRFAGYGKLSGRTADDLKAGARVEVNEAKSNPMDFALWKAAKPGEISWESLWGPGRPGWHIECSAMSIKYLGAGFDMHGGGEDLVFPHHENEIAQSEAFLGSDFVRYWIHNAFITVNGERMGKSMGNFSTIRDIRSKFPPKVIRYLFAGTHYRNPISFGDTELTAASKGLERIEIARFNWEHLLKQEAVSGVTDEATLNSMKEIVATTKEEFVNALEDDFNTPQALAGLHDLVREVNRAIQGKDFQLTQDIKDQLQKNLECLLTFGEMLGILMNKQQEINQASEAEIEELVARRIQAKKDKNWTLADQIRNDLKAKGVILEDTPQGVRWRLE